MFRLCVVGSGGVGKSSVTIRYLKNEFTEYYDPTLEEVYRAQDLEEERETSKDEIMEYCNSMNTPLIETSAKTGLNVQECFQLMMRQIHRIQPSLLERTVPNHFEENGKKKDCSIL
ncbi:hypothetical protein QZH41_017055 [Actinostola sp. cb2023]|nr:hypothetical protein QZH41_017055 [Actinostola sp. cb2023]